MSLTQQAIVPLALRFRHSAQGAVQRYVDCFGLVPQFGADANMMILWSDDLQLALPYADEALCRVNAEYADRQHAGLPETGYGASYAVLWLATQPLGSVGLGDLAEALGMSVRNLQRALHGERSSWTRLLDEARRAALSGMLKEGCSLDAAAQRLGYHDASSVGRAARRWFGQAPKRWVKGL
ncbi:helix-turn-helix domain-containing protein [Massilia sp. CCM 8695]|uniref:Helix-turn-helix domain-containing protein n=1 Tax=Massilia frigida TaxID=2609281 RepID=A0ABX0NBL4_9BURK|nr:AraC family transcriptional regulator [Massilia frigida]NHZ82845.1 helix-turn-helix domain-containing protein [Massilia frigida]